MNDLGFSDLTEDEAMLVALYREWACQREGGYAFELRVILILSNDVLHPFLKDIFTIFQHINADSINIHGLGDVLSEQEGLVLDAVSAYLCGASEKLSQRSAIDIRPTTQITCSNRDLLRLRINQSSWRAALTF